MVSALGDQAAVSDWPMRLFLTAATAAVIVAVLLAMRAGWRRRSARQQWAPLPPVPTTSAAVHAVTGKYVGTVRGRDGLDRIVAGGPVAPASVAPVDTGLLILRQGDDALFVPGRDIEDVGTAPGMLTKVFGSHGIVLVTWRWGGRTVSSGLWFPDEADARAVMSWVRDLMGAAEPAARGEVSR